jgi:hypothetical protein
VSSIIGAVPRTAYGELKRKKTDAEKEAIAMAGIPEGFRAICFMVPSRAFRIIADDEDRIFQIQQLDHAHGYTWVNMQRHKGDFKWEAWSHSWNAAAKMQETFLLALRKKKVEHQRMVRNAQGGKRLI